MKLVNGNDILEFQQENEEKLEIDFLRSKRISEDTDLQDLFQKIPHLKMEFSTFVENEFYGG